MQLTVTAATAVCARVFAHACMRACVHADVFAIYDKKYLTQADNNN